jgi:hypothetical protein
MNHLAQFNNNHHNPLQINKHQITHKNNHKKFQHPLYIINQIIIKI